MNKILSKELRRVHLGLSKQIRNLHLASMENVSTKFMGEYTSRFKGNGIEFADFRQYVPSDDASKIDWLHTLKAGKLLVREYDEERNLTMFFVVDVSNSMLFGSQAQLKHEFAAELVASIASGALSAGDAVGELLTSSRVSKFTKIALGARQFKFLLRDLTSQENYGGKCNIGSAIGRASALLPPSSLLFIVTDFITHDRSWKKNIRVAARKHHVVALVAHDECDHVVLAGVGQIAVQDPYSGEQMLIDSDRVRERYKHEAKRNLEETVSFLHSSGVQIVMLSTARDFVPVVNAFLRRRVKWS